MLALRLQSCAAASLLRGLLLLLELLPAEDVKDTDL
jgi:hypothetical protein